jgi:hypothetical protein
LETPPSLKLSFQRLNTEWERLCLRNVWVTPNWSASLMIDSFSEAEKLLLAFDIIPKFSDLID